jgi:hypothetical protein
MFSDSCESLDFTGLDVGLNDVLSQFTGSDKEYLLVSLVPRKSSATW